MLPEPRTHRLGGLVYMLKYLKETTDWGGSAGNHTYIMDGTKCIGYIMEGTDKQEFFKKPSVNFSKRGRKFKEIKI